MGFLKLILNILLLWTAPIPCPDDISWDKETLHIADKEQGGQFQDRVVIVIPAEIILSTEDLPVLKDSPASGFLKTAPECPETGNPGAFTASSSPYQHLLYERRLMYPFHSFL